MDVNQTVKKSESFTINELENMVKQTRPHKNE